MENYKKLQNLAWLREIAASGKTVKGLDNIPTLFPEAQFYWEAYVMLAVKRQKNERGPQPIAMSEILAYATFMRIDDDVLREDLLYMVSALDAAFLEHVNKPKPKDGKQNNSRPPRRPRR